MKNIFHGIENSLLPGKAASDLTASTGLAAGKRSKRKSASPRTSSEKESGQEKRPTITQLASHLKVHPSTISLALRGSSEVSVQMRDRIRALAQEWGYMPNQMARSLRSRRTKLLGVVFPFASIPHYGTLLDHISQRIERMGYRSEIIFHEWNPEREKKAIRSLMEQQAEGILCASSTTDPESLLEELVPPHQQFPYVMFGGPPKIRPWKSVRGCVIPDTHHGAQLLTRHLLDRGHTNIALLIGDFPKGRGQAAMRVVGMRNECRRHAGVQFQLVTLDDSDRPDGGREIVTKHGSTPAASVESNRILAQKFLKLRSRPTAVVTSDELGAHVLLAIMREKGLSVPEDISLACFGGSLLSAYGSRPLTSINHPYEEMAQSALDLLFRAEDAQGSRLRWLRPLLADRGSIATIAPPVRRLRDFAIRSTALNQNKKKYDETT